MSVNSIRFPMREGLHARVQQYCTDNPLLTTGDGRLLLKTGLLRTGFARFSILYVCYATSLRMALLRGVALAQGFSWPGFTMLHAGAHCSCARPQPLTWFMPFILARIGGSPVRWCHQHNILPHTSPNLPGVDAERPPASLCRLHPAYPWHLWHREPPLPAWPLSSVVTLSGVLYGDERACVAGPIGPRPLPRPTRVGAGAWVVTKLGDVGYMLVLPACFHPVLYVFIAFVVMHVVVGFTLSPVFQLAHTVEHTAFPIPEPHTGRMAHAWAVHQVETTANVAPTHVFARWYLGGLNFQIEHHLFASMCHIHYPAISTIVRQTCDEFAIPYVCYPTVWVAIVAHYRWLQALGSRRMLPPNEIGRTVP